MSDLSIGNFGFSMGRSEPLFDMDENLISTVVKNQLLSLGLENYRNGSHLPLHYARESIVHSLSLSDVDPGTIDLVVFATNSFWAYKDIHRTNISLMLDELGINRAFPLLVSMGGCANLHNAMIVASQQLKSPEITTALIVTTDCVKPGMSRVVPPELGVFSDGGASLIISKKLSLAFNYLLTHQFTDISLCNVAWQEANPDKYMSGVVKGCYLTFKKTLLTAKIEKQDVDLVVINNYNESVVKAVSHICGLSLEKIYANTLATHAHLVAADNILNLYCAIDEGRIKQGSKVMLLGSGPNNWACSLIEMN